MFFNGIKYEKFKVGSNDKRFINSFNEDPYKDLKVTTKEDISVESFLQNLIYDKPCEYEISDKNVSKEQLLTILSLGYGIAHESMELIKWWDIINLKVMSDEMSSRVNRDGEIEYLFFKPGKYEPSIYDYNLYKDLSNEEKNIFASSSAKMEALITFTSYLHKLDKRLDIETEQYIEKMGESFDNINTMIGIPKLIEVELNIQNYDHITEHISALSSKKNDTEIKNILEKLYNEDVSYEKLNEEFKDSLYTGTLASKLNPIISEESAEIEPMLIEQKIR